MSFFGKGTFVTGCITAARNGIGVVGVAYNAVARFSAGFGCGPMGDAGNQPRSLMSNLQSNPVAYPEPLAHPRWCSALLFLDVINLSWSQRPDFGTSDTRTYVVSGTIWSNLDLSVRLFDYGRNSPFKMAQAASQGRGGHGTVVLASAGNARLDFDRTDNHHIQNDRHVMSIAAHDR